MIGVQCLQGTNVGSIILVHKNRIRFLLVAHSGYGQWLAHDNLDGYLIRQGSELSSVKNGQGNEKRLLYPMALALQKGIRLLKRNIAVCVRVRRRSLCESSNKT